MSRNLDTIRRLLPKLKDNEVTFLRKLLNQESIDRDLKKDNPIANNRLYTVLQNVYGRGRWDISFDYESALAQLTYITEKDFKCNRLVGEAVLAAAKMELSKRNLSFKSITPETTKA